MAAPQPVYYHDSLVSYSENPTEFKGLPPKGGMRSRIGIGAGYRGKTLPPIEEKDDGTLILPAETARHLLTDAYLGRPVRRNSMELNLVLPPGTKGRPSGFYSLINSAVMFKRLTVSGSGNDGPFIHGLRMNSDIKHGVNPRYMVPQDIAAEFNVDTKVVQEGLAKAASGFTELVLQTQNPNARIKGNKSIMFNLPNPHDTTKSKSFPVFVIPAHLNEYIPTVLDICEKTVMKNLKLGYARNGTENNLNKMMNFAEFSNDERLLNSIMSYDQQMRSQVPLNAYEYLHTVQPPDGDAALVPFAVPHAPTLSENRPVPVIPPEVVKRSNGGGSPTPKRPRSSLGSSSQGASSSTYVPSSGASSSTYVPSYGASSSNAVPFSGETAFQQATNDDGPILRPVLESDSDSE